MRVLLAGATGAIGRRLVPALVGAGHDVTGTSRSKEGLDLIAAMGGRGVRMNALDAAEVGTVVAEAEPEVVIHQLTSIEAIDPKDFDSSFEATIALRTKGIDHLVEASIGTGASRFIAQSFTGWTNQRTGGPIKTEEDPLDTDPAKSSVKTMAAIAYLESTVTTASRIEGLVLRYGNLYGPGTGFAAGGDTYEAVQARKLPIVGGGAGVWSFVHVDDAAGATVNALNHGTTGLYNIVDDEPAPISEWLPAYAEAIGARPPRRVPAWLAKGSIGEQGVRLMTETRGSANAKAKDELDWQPQHPTWRDGFRNAH